MKYPALKPDGLFTTLSIFFLYDDLINFKGELMLFGSLYPNGPYIGFPSYAQPIIDEWFVGLSKSPLLFISKVSFSKLLSSCWSHPITP